jgi:hypothetical protein
MRISSSGWQTVSAGDRQADHREKAEIVQNTGENGVNTGEK